MQADDRFSLRFYGVRGTLPVPGVSTLHYGGNTSCVEVRCGAHTIILDAGTGLKVLGDHWIGKKADILLSHTHIDHVLGLMFFMPAYDRSRELTLWAGHLKPEHDLRQIISHLMSPPLFPLTPDNFLAQMRYNDFVAGDELQSDHWEQAGIRIRTLPLSHPDRATGYRIEYGGHSLCYITDYEHVPGQIDSTLLEFIRDTDCLIYDSTYTDEHFAQYIGWGHSTWQQAVRLAEAAHAKTLAVFHHDPDANDAMLKERSKSLKALRPGAVIAAEGLEIHLNTDAKSRFTISNNTATTLDPVTLAERLTSIGLALSAENDLNRLLEIILTEAQSLSGADGGTLYYRTEDNRLEFSIIRNDTLNIAYGGTTGKKAPLEPLHLYDPKTGDGNYAVQAAFSVLVQKTINILDVYDAEGFDFVGTKKFDQDNNSRTRSVITIPMISHKKEALGCLQLINAKDPLTDVPIPFSTQTQHLLESLASQAAIILDNKQLILSQKHLLESFIQMIAKAIDAKSPYTGAHCERVPLLTNMLAAAACNANDGPFKDFAMSDEEKYELHIAGWMHDCGKVTTPVHVMDKSTKLETIADRIELVKTRFELLKQQAQIEYLETQQQPGANREILQAAYQDKLKQFDDEVAFLCKINIGSEFMSDEQLARLQTIARERVWHSDGVSQPAITENELYNLSIRRGTLTNEERNIMNDHMVQTCQMLESLPFPRHLRRVPEYAGGHHERMDGKGYPKGIRAGDMSIPARMMAVADVFEALTAGDRPYKSAKKLSEAMRIIGDMKKHNHLDPIIVDFFITSGVYRAYAQRFLEPHMIDAVDEQMLLAITPLPI